MIHGRQLEGLEGRLARANIGADEGREGVKGLRGGAARAMDEVGAGGGRALWGWGGITTFARHSMGSSDAGTKEAERLLVHSSDFLFARLIGKMTR